VLAGVTGFILDREIVPLLQLRPGAGYAVVTFTRWVIVIAGAILTLAALGVDPAKVTLVAGALSVGIGFGLQNVVNNFVSGLILIVERPVGVGDLIEVGPLTGEVKRIGIRSSTVRTGQGAEVIVPNSELVSKEGGELDALRPSAPLRHRRRASLTVSDPEHVMRLLVEAADEVPEIMKSPPPLRNVPRASATARSTSGCSRGCKRSTWDCRRRTGCGSPFLRKLDQAGIAIPSRSATCTFIPAGDGASIETGSWMARQRVIRLGPQAPHSYGTP
jgi:small-conductance mechanosensitive channel